MESGPAVIWSGALQASATVLAGAGARWGIDDPTSTAWGPSAGSVAGVARRVVELAAQIIMELPDDPEAGVPQAKEAARQWLRVPPPS